MTTSSRASALVSARTRGGNRSAAMLRCQMDQLELGLVPIDAIDPHEIYTPDHEQLVGDRIDRDGFLANPIIVSDRGGGRFILLDGTHRLEYLRSRGMASAPVQIVRLHDPASVKLATWRHLVAGAVLPDLLHAAHASGLALTKVSEAEGLAGLRDGFGLAALVAESGQAVVVDGAPWPDALRRLVALYGTYDRLADDADPETPATEPAGASSLQRQRLLVSFRLISPAAVEDFVQAGERIPAGITRVVLHGGRALGLKTPLDLLQAGVSPMKQVEQMKWLDAVRHARPRWFPNGGVICEPNERHYAEPLLVFADDIVVQPLDERAKARRAD